MKQTCGIGQRGQRQSTARTEDTGYCVPYGILAENMQILSGSKQGFLSGFRFSSFLGWVTTSSGLVAQMDCAKAPLSTLIWVFCHVHPPFVVLNFIGPPLLT